MGIEIVLHEGDLLRLRKMRIRQILEDVGVVYGGVATGDLDMPPAFQGANIMNRLAVPFRSYS